MKTPLPHCPRLEGTPDERLANFIASGRASGAFGAELDFNASPWDVTDHVRRREGVPAVTGRLYLNFAAPGDASSVDPSEMESFIRAYISLIPRRINHGVLINFCLAARAIEAAMRRSGVTRVGGLTVKLLDDAVWEASTRLGAKSLHTRSFNVARLAHFLSANGMTDVSLLGWSPPVGKPRLPELGSEEAMLRAVNRLPSPEVMAALPEAFRRAEARADVIMTRLGLLLFTTPQRLNELLAVDVEPEVERSLDGMAHLGLRMPGSKGHPGAVKWVPSRLAPLARRCLEDLREATREGRRMKAWYDTRPDSLYLPESLEYLRGKSRLFAEEAAVLLGLGPAQLLHWLGERRQMSVPAVNKSVADTGEVSFGAVERQILERLPDSMRDCGGVGSAPLLVVQLHTFATNRRFASPCMFEAVKADQVRAALTPAPNRLTVFQRLGVDPGGKLALPPHSPRHLLDHLLRKGGLSETAAATLAGRIDPRQNRHYDHRTDEDLLQLTSRGNAASRRVTSPLARPAGGARRQGNGSGRDA